MAGVLKNRPKLIIACISVLLLIAVFVAYWRLSKTMIRVHNASRFDYQDLQVGDQRYGPLPASGVTEYRDFGVAYSYNYVRLLIDNHEFIFQPIDYVGEQPLGGGSYTYEIVVADYGTRRLDITTRTD